MLFFRIAYSIAVVCVFIFFKDSMNISLYMALLYSGIAILGLLILDVLLGGIKSTKILSSALTGILFLGIGFLLISSFQAVFQKKEIDLIVLFVFLYAGIMLGNKHYQTFEMLFKQLVKKVDHDNEPKVSIPQKVLDTSTLIDGRIANMVECGYFENTLVVPTFVLTELQNIADSHDHLRRQKGRRGLSILQKLREQDDVKIEINNETFDEIGTVDDKIIALCLHINAGIITTDFNLMKVAKIRNIKVLNLNNLSIALKQTVLAGEEFTITITKEGKEPTQGVGYLDDGTMVVLENGRNRIGETLKVETTSVLQIESGSIIFVKAISNSQSNNQSNIQGNTQGNNYGEEMKDTIGSQLNSKNNRNNNNNNSKQTRRR